MIKFILFTSVLAVSVLWFIPGLAVDAAMWVMGVFNVLTWWQRALILFVLLILWLVQLVSDWIREGLMRRYNLEAIAESSLGAAEDDFDEYFQPVVADAQLAGADRRPPEIQQLSPAWLRDVRARRPKVVRLLVRELRTSMHCGRANRSEAQMKACAEWVLRWCERRGVTRSSDLHFILPIVVRLAFCDSEADFVSGMVDSTLAANMWRQTGWLGLARWILASDPQMA